MGRTACTESQCLYKGALYLYFYFFLLTNTSRLQILKVTRYLETMPENGILQLFYRHDRCQRRPTNERGKRNQKTPRSQSVWRWWRKAKHWSVGTAGCREEHRWVAHQDSKMCPECRGILDTRLEPLAGALESYVSSTLELQTSVRPSYVLICLLLSIGH